MRLSAFIAELQRLQVEAGDNDPHVLTDTPSEHYSRLAVFGPQLKTVNPGGEYESNAEIPKVLAVILPAKHYSHDPDYDYLWKDADHR